MLEPKEMNKSIDQAERSMTSYRPLRAACEEAACRPNTGGERPVQTAYVSVPLSGQRRVTKDVARRG